MCAYKVPLTRLPSSIQVTSWLVLACLSQPLPSQLNVVLGGLPGLSCSVENVSLTPQVGTSNGDCVIGPSVTLQPRSWYRDNFCGGDFLANYVDKDPKDVVEGQTEQESDPQAQNTTRIPLRNSAEGRGKPSPWLLFAMFALTFSLNG